MSQVNLHLYYINNVANVLEFYNYYSFNKIN